MLAVTDPCQREMQPGRVPCPRPSRHTNHNAYSNGNVGSGARFAAGGAAGGPPGSASTPPASNNSHSHTQQHAHLHLNNNIPHAGHTGHAGGGKRGGMASAATPYRASWGPGPPPLRYPPPPQHQQQAPPQQQVGPGPPLLPQQVPVQQAQPHYHQTQTPQQVGPPMHHNTHTQYATGARVPTAASPSNTTSSSSSATGSQSGTLSTSLSNNNAGAGVPPEQLSRTNLYIRGLTQTTTDKDLVSMCHQYGTIISTKAILDKNTNKCKGYGFVDFENVGSAEEAVKGLQANGVQAQMAKVGIWLLRRPNSQQEQDPTNLYMANLPPDFKENDVDNLLKNFGQVVSTRILRDPYGQSKGVGFARMESRDKCEQIIQVFNGNALAGAKEPLLVKFADGGNKKKSQYKVPERSPWREPMDPTHQLLCSVAGAGGPVYGCGAGGDLGVGVGVGGVYRGAGGVYVSGYPMTSHWVPAPYPIMQPAHHMPPHHIDPEYAMQVSRGDRAVGLVLPEPPQQFPAQLLPHTLQLAPPQYMAPHPYGYMSSTGSLLHALPMEPDHSTAASPDEPYQPYPPK